ncbi:hypothetical protein DY000_02045295 [Brassica cretica]|uniref:Uncharacterized protein n=1 Tax=Brassica cretica TaxID=69181 RepID=A0ABQ7F4P1_BRACR|nr:hypothetical protein DY000_02045295 [Brassica cretica]
MKNLIDHGQEIMDMKSWTGDHGQEILDRKSWTENHGQKIMDRKTEARKGTKDSQSLRQFEETKEGHPRDGDDRSHVPMFDRKHGDV